MSSLGQLETALGKSVPLRCKIMTGDGDILCLFRTPMTNNQLLLAVPPVLVSRNP